MLIDLHTHSTASDGTDSPAELVCQAADRGIDVLGLTDHDTIVGWAQAQAAADDAGIRLVRGLEISTSTERVGVHLLAYLPDPDDAALRGELDSIVTGRDGRLTAMIGNLNALGIEITEADVRRHAPEATGVGRPHLAQALVEAGHVADLPEAFGGLLAPGGPVWVKRYAADTEAMVSIVTAAGGAAVVAHPWGTRGNAERVTSRDVLTPATIERLVRAGLVGVEVDHTEHDAATRRELRGLAGDLGLVMTGSSDYHGTRKVNHDLACHTTDADQLERLLDAAATNALARAQASAT